jgi:CubicO group peptidase (beta-lactamase class C family)
MKNLIQITTVLFLFIQTIGYSQTKNTETISKKQTTNLKNQNTKTKIDTKILKEFIGEYLLEDDYKGIAILVKKGNQIHTASMGGFNLEENSVFNIASATKTFTAILILQELEKGNLQLTDSIGKFLTPIKNVPQWLTIENLLTHESGLDEVAGKNIEDIFYAKNDSIYNAQLLQQVERYDKEMFGKFDYCNTNYFLLGKILEKITDRSYFDLLDERIINPLGLKNTHPYVSKSIPNLATPYHKGEDVTSYLDYRFFRNTVNAAGSMASTLPDMEKFYTSLFETEILLKKETLKMMMDSGNETYGFGLFKLTYEGQNYYGHGGNNIGYSFRNGYNPKTKNLYLMFTNSQRISSEQLLKNNLLAFLHDKKIESLNPVDIASFKKYIGTYLLKEANLVLKLVQEENKLYLVVDAQGIKSKIMQKDESTLYDTTVGATLSIIKGDDTHLRFNQNGFETTLARLPKKD